jgi:hypothetical protein
MGAFLSPDRNNKDTPNEAPSLGREEKTVGPRPVSNLPLRVSVTVFQWDLLMDDFDAATRMSSTLLNSWVTLLSACAITHDQNNRHDHLGTPFLHVISCDSVHGRTKRGSKVAVKKRKMR